MEKAMPQRKRLYSSVLPPRGVTAHLCCAVVLYLTASLYSLAETPAADAAIPRLALLASGDEKAAAIVALVEAELSARGKSEESRGQPSTACCPNRKIFPHNPK